MEEKHPKRKKDSANPYTLSIENGIKYVSFEDSEGYIQKIEISSALFSLFDEFELDDVSYMNVVIATVLMVKDTIGLQHTHEHSHNHNHEHRHGSLVHTHVHEHCHAHTHIHEDDESIHDHPYDGDDSEEHIHEHN